MWKHPCLPRIFQGLTKLWKTLNLFIKYSKLVLLGSEDEIKSMDWKKKKPPKKMNEKKQVTKLFFLTQIDPLRVSSPVLDLPCLCLHCSWAVVLLFLI
jgi:hypothetical protein